MAKMDTRIKELESELDAESRLSSEAQTKDAQTRVDEAETNALKGIYN